MFGQVSEKEFWKVINDIRQEFQFILDEVRRNRLELDHDRRVLRFILSELSLQPYRISGFSSIKEITMAPIAPGQTPQFSTTTLPAGTVPSPANLPTWISSDPVNAPVTVLPTDPSALSVSVAIPDTAVVGATFDLTVSYTNSDGVIATQTNTFTIVAPPAPDITGFTPIVQTA